MEEAIERDKRQFEETSKALTAELEAKKKEEYRLELKSLVKKVEVCWLINNM